jgi:glycosyltransferase involved in cell wall biosynthesis
MIGSGPLLHECRELTRSLGISHAVTFLDDQPHTVVQDEMRRSLCFVQHSMVAPSGDSEGTPVSIIEAGASGLPVIATQHAGIPDVVLDGRTGFLVREGDVESMAERMLVLLKDVQLAGRMGKAARIHIQENFASEQRLGRLWQIIEESKASYAARLRGAR